MAILNNSNAISTGGYDVNNSLRFRASASAYLSRTPASASNRQTWTWSGWVKRGRLGVEVNGLFAGRTSASATYTLFYFSETNTLNFLDNGGANLTTTQLFRDPSAWYHLVLSVDTTQATAANRVKMYVNGNQITAFSTATYPTQNANLNVNTAATHVIGDNPGAAQLLDGYLAEVNFVDGQALTPSSFGETDTTTGVWKPKAYTGTYGTNGFYLKFSDIATTSGSNAGLGKDFSGNTNYWTTNNISVTSGTTYDAMTDSPTNTSATVANYAVLNPLNKGSSLTIADGNLYADATTTTVATTYSTLRIDTATYWENYISATDGAGYPLIGAGTGISTGGVTGAGSWSVGSDGYTYLNGTSANAGYTFTSTDIIQCAYDPVTGKFWLGKNNTWFGSGNPATGANPVATIATSNQIYALISHYGNSNSSANFGQRPFAYTPPTGFVALNTYNLPDSTIKKGNSYMDATLWTGDGNASQTVVNSGSMKPDFLWAKCRSTAGTNNVLIDSVRGTNVWLASDSTAADASGTLSTFLSNGIAPTSSGLNTSTRTYVGWQWQAGQGTNTTNNAGSITSTVSVNTTAGFSVVTYTGNGTSSATVGHGLGVVPKMIIYKRRNDVGNWIVHHTSLGNNGSNYAFLEMNTTSATQTVSSYLPVGGLSSTTFMTGTTGSINASGGTYVAYCWAEIAGFSKFGSYTGNGSSDGVFVYLGFRPKYFLLKRTDTGGYEWYVFDTARNTYNAVTNKLYPNLSNAEDSLYAQFDFVSNGIKIRDSRADWNGNGATYIYAAFAESPFSTNNRAR